MSNFEKRLTDLEKKTRKTATAARPSYRQFATEGEYQTWLRSYSGPFVKVYVSCGPDDWPDPPQRGADPPKQGR